MKNYTRVVKAWNDIEIKVTETGTFWAIFQNGQKHTEFMNCKGSCAPFLVQQYLIREGLNTHNRPFL